MANPLKAALPILIVLALAGCGGSFTGTSAATKPQLTDVFVAGNSLTYYGATPSLGWSGNWGMAATAADDDFSHVVASGLGVPEYGINISTMEQNPSTAAAVVAPLVANVHPGTLVVVELGENVSDLTGVTFQPAYDTLLQGLGGGARLVCLSTWWQQNALDAMMAKECALHNGTYVYIGDIYTNPANPDLTDNLYVNAAVNSHPHDWGMAQIAGRVLAVVK